MTPFAVCFFHLWLSQEPPALLAWPPGVEHRFVWVQNGRKVGETTFLLEAAKQGSALHLLKAQRTSDYPSFSLRAQGTTTFRADGTPVKFEESLSGTSLNRKQVQQETSIYFEGEVAKLRYRHHGSEEHPRDVKYEEGTFLIATNAVEHWALFAAMLPPGFERKEVKLFYPDFGQALEVTIAKTGTEKLDVGGNEVEATRYSFLADRRDLRGSLWLDKARRLLKIHFPNQSPELGLTVMLSPRK